MSAQELDQYRRQFDEIVVSARELTAGLTESQFNWRPSPERWSIQECLGHLIITGQSTLKAVERAMERARSNHQTAAGPFRYGPVDRFFVRSLDTGSKRKFRAPRRLHPVHGQPVTAILPTFLHIQSQFQHQIQAADGLDLARIKVDTLISRFYKMSLGMTFALVAAHERRHLQQAREVRAMLPDSTAGPQSKSA